MNDLALLPSLSTLFVTPLPEIVFNHLRQAVMEVYSIFYTKKNIFNFSLRMFGRFFKLKIKSHRFGIIKKNRKNRSKPLVNKEYTIEKLGDHVKSSLHKVLYIISA
jgi:hypothetical protein